MLGTMAAMTPMGTPISQTFSSGRCRSMPTVFILRTASATILEAKRFFVVLSSTFPKPVSLTAISASSTALSEKAFATASTMASSFSWAISARMRWAFSAPEAMARASCRASKSLSNSIPYPLRTAGWSRRRLSLSVGHSPQSPSSPAIAGIPEWLSFPSVPAGLPSPGSRWSDSSA